MKEIGRIKIDSEGNTQVDITGVSGPGCAKITDGISRALGQNVGETVKPEFYDAGGGEHQEVSQ